MHSTEGNITMRFKLDKGLNTLLVFCILMIQPKLEKSWGLSNNIFSSQHPFKIFLGDIDLMQKRLEKSFNLLTYLKKPAFNSMILTLLWV